MNNGFSIKMQGQLRGEKVSSKAGDGIIEYMYTKIVNFDSYLVSRTNINPNESSV